MKNIAVIPARSGSKGLPDKNIRPVNGKPLLAYTIEAALESGCFDTVHVSTDSERYAEIARQYGADVPFLRSAALAYAFLQKKQAKSVIAVCEVDHSPLWCDTIPDSGSMKGFGRKDLAWVNRQDLRPYYRVNGAIYLLSVNEINIPPDDEIYEDNCYALFMDRKKSVDVDSEDDLALVEFLLARRAQG